MIVPQLSASSIFAQKRRIFVILRCLFLLVLFLSGVASSNASVRDWERGIAITSESPDQLLSPSSDAVITRAAQIGANFISLSPTWYQNDEGSIFVQPRQETTISDAALIHAIQQAHKVGLKVMVIPFLDLYDGKWNGFIVPRDQDIWWGNYKDFILHYARIASANGVEQFSVGRELVRQSNNPANAGRWHDLLAQVRSLYSGKITYQANWGKDWAREYDKVTFWGDPNIDIIGVNGYFPVGDPDAYKNGNPGLQSLINGWQAHIKMLEQLQNRYQKPLLISEVGYRSVDGTAIEPFAHWREGGYNPEEQALAYRAFFQAWQNVPWMAGVFWWEWKSDPSAVRVEDKYYSSQNKPAEKVLEEMYGPYRSASQATLAVVQTPAPIPVAKKEYQRPGDTSDSVPKTSMNIPVSQPVTVSKPDSDQIQILWPQDQASVGGFGQIKAIYKGKPLSDYDLTWRVDDGGENYFVDGTGSDAHKEAKVNFSTWTWQPSGHYRLTITAKDQQGRQIGQRQIEIIVKQ
jgi:hypothetical protein